MAIVAAEAGVACSAEVKRMYWSGADGSQARLAPSMRNDCSQWQIAQCSGASDADGAPNRA